MIKKRILYISCYVVCIYGMEPKHFSLISHGTLISVKKESLFNAKNIDFLVVGHNQQNILKQGNNYSFHVGRIRYSHRNIIYEENEISNSDNYKVYKVNHKLLTHIVPKNIIYQQIACNKLSITEPTILSSYSYPDQKYTIGYYVELIKKNGSKVYDVYDNCALMVAAKHLAICYEQVLIEAFKKLKHKAQKSIGFSTISADMGFPRDKAAQIAIKTIFKFITKYPKAYHHIDFFVQKESDFILYTQLLSKFPKIYLLLCAHTHKDNIFSLFPRDIIYYIAYILNLIG